MGEFDTVLFTGCHDYEKAIRCWNPLTGGVFRTLEFCDARRTDTKSQVNCIAVSADRELLAAGGNHIYRIYDWARSQKSVSQVEKAHSKNVTAIGFQRH